MMAQQDIERILDKIEELQEKMTAMQIKLDTHCQTQAAAPDWKTYLLFTVLGALVSQGPAGISILSKWMGMQVGIVTP